MLSASSAITGLLSSSLIEKEDNLLSDTDDQSMASELFIRKAPEFLKPNKNPPKMTILTHRHPSHVTISKNNHGPDVINGFIAKAGCIIVIGAKLSAIYEKKLVGGLFRQTVHVIDLEQIQK